jgi:hypothetical protein
MNQDCNLWIGPKDAYGHPISTWYPRELREALGIPKGQVARVRHVIFEARHGYRPRRIVATCGRRNCINPDHLTDGHSSPIATPDSGVAIELQLAQLLQMEQTPEVQEAIRQLEAKRKGGEQDETKRERP